MKYSKTFSFQTSGLRAEPITIEVDIANGLHSFTIVGLGDKAVNESRDRVSSAIKNSGFISPKQKNQKVTVSLAPADTRKEGPAFDLGIAITYLHAAGDIDPFIDLTRHVFIGELALDGRISSVRGIIPMLIEAKRLKKDFDTVYIPKENAREARHITGIRIRPVATIHEVIDCLRGILPIDSPEKEIQMGPSKTTNKLNSGVEDGSNNHDHHYDFSAIDGHYFARRALEIAAVGGHHILLYGPPGAGKTMLARAFHSILPEPNEPDFLDILSIQSSFMETGIPGERPFRAPHHTGSHTSIVGGGSPIQPGEITLAHRGVLFLDELPEFDRRTIESLRQPLEDKTITLNRIKDKVIYPCDFTLIATMNLCPCGYGDDRCRCTEREQKKYREKISSAILDRIDIFIPVVENYDGSYDLKEKTGQRKNESSTSILSRVERAITYRTQLEMTEKERLPEKTRKIIKKICAQRRLSTRSRIKLISVARSIADLAHEKEINNDHVLEAMQYRQRPWEEDVKK